MNGFVWISNCRSFSKSIISFQSQKYFSILFWSHKIKLKNLNGPKCRNILVLVFLFSAASFNNLFCMSFSFSNWKNEIICFGLLLDTWSRFCLLVQFPRRNNYKMFSVIWNFLLLSFSFEVSDPLKTLRPNERFLGFNFAALPLWIIHLTWLSRFTGECKCLVAPIFKQAEKVDLRSCLSQTYNRKYAFKFFVTTIRIGSLKTDFYLWLSLQLIWL